MQKPARTVLALAAGSLVLGMVSVGAAAANDNSLSRGVVLAKPGDGKSGSHDEKHYTVGKVVSRTSLKIRTEPTTQSEVVGTLEPGEKVEIVCKTHGEPVDGNDLWYRLAEEKDESGKEEHGRDDSGKEEHGRGDSGKEEHGRGDSGKEDYGQEHHGRGDSGKEEEEEEEYGRPGSGHEDYGQEHYGREDSGKEEHGQGHYGRDDSKRASDHKYHEEAWVAARYVKNLGEVAWCG